MLVLHFVLMFWVVRGSCIVHVFQRIQKWRNGKLCGAKEERSRKSSVNLREPTRVEPDFELVSSIIFVAPEKCELIICSVSLLLVLVTAIPAIFS